MTLDQSAAFYQLVSQVEAAINASSSSYDFASRANPILDAAAGMEPTERDVIFATVSVAENSYEYWESQYAAFASTFTKEYSDCASTVAGSSSGDGRDQCLNSGLTDAVRQGSRSPLLFKFAALSPGSDCDLLPRFKSLIWADFRGAVIGALSSFWIPGGVFFGAFRGGAAASLASFMDSTWDLFWCAMP
jgi:hypothetical protein